MVRPRAGSSQEGKELKTLICPHRWEGVGCHACSLGLLSLPGGEGTPALSLCGWHCALIKRIPGVENSWRACSAYLSLAPRKEQGAFFSSQVVAEAGKKQGTHIGSRAHSDPNSQCSVNLSFLIPRDRQWPTWNTVKLAQVWTWVCAGWRERILYHGQGWALGGGGGCFQPVNEAEGWENHVSVIEASAAGSSKQSLGRCVHICSLVTFWSCQEHKKSV